MEVINKIGRRKNAIARVYLSEGSGKITINNTEFKAYFPTGTLQYVVKQPLNLLEVADKYDIKITLDGGGIMGQAEAARLGITRALIEIDEECRGKLKAEGFVRRDPREVERKKPGQKKARKKFQFSKR